MVLKMDNIFRNEQGIPVEDRTVLTRQNGVMAIIVPGTATNYWSIPGIGFQPANANWSNTGLRIYMGSNSFPMTSVFLPHGAVVTAVVVYGSNTAKVWRLTRAALAVGWTTSDLATANFNTEDTTISDATIDNSLYTYGFISEGLISGEAIDGARITYTLSPYNVGGTGLSINTTAYAAVQNLRGFKGTFTINNMIGSQQTYNYTITNTTKGTTLEAFNGLVIANGAYRTQTFIWTSDEVKSGDGITFTITSGNVGTAGSSNYLGYMAFFVESIEETNEAT